MFSTSGSQQWPLTASREPQLCEEPGQVPHDGHRTDASKAPPEPAALGGEAPGGQHAPLQPAAPSSLAFDLADGPKGQC